MKHTGGTFMRKFGWTLIYGGLFVLLSAGVYLSLTKLLAIREIIVVGGNIQVVVDQKRLPKTLLFFPSDKIREQILADNPILADIRFEKKYPHTLGIVPTLRRPSALLTTPSRRVLIDDRGTVLADADGAQSELPQIVAPIAGLRVGQQIVDARVVSGLAFLSASPSLSPIETVTITEDGVIRAHTGNLDILFTQERKVTEIIATLQTLLTGFRIKGTLPKVIDLRFDKPVVTF